MRDLSPDLAEGSPSSADLAAQAQRVVALYTKAGVRLAVAESCTGGLVAAALTAVPGASAMFERGWVTYSDEAKRDLLGVPEDVLIRHGAVSAEVAEAMAKGVLNHAPLSVTVALATTGIAGPSGGTDKKPVGLVYLGVAGRATGGVFHVRCLFKGDRTAVRLQTVREALHLAIAALP